MYEPLIMMPRGARRPASVIGGHKKQHTIGGQIILLSGNKIMMSRCFKYYQSLAISAVASRRLAASAASASAPRRPSPPSRPAPRDVARAPAGRRHGVASGVRHAAITQPLTAAARRLVTVNKAWRRHRLWRVDIGDASPFGRRMIRRAPINHHGAGLLI